MSASVECISIVECVCMEFGVVTVMGYLFRTVIAAFFSFYLLFLFFYGSSPGAVFHIDRPRRRRWTSDLPLGHAFLKWIKSPSLIRGLSRRSGSLYSVLPGLVSEDRRSSLPGTIFLPSFLFVL